MIQEPLVVVTAHKGILIIDARIKEEHPDWVPIGPGKIGCVLIDTKAHLGISKEALDLLEKIERSHDDIGDVDWFDSVHGKCFAWLGSPKRFVNPDNTEGSRNHAVYRDDCTIISNVSDPEDIEAIVNFMNPKLS
jgi:hypothetical protein